MLRNGRTTSETTRQGMRRRLKFTSHPACRAGEVNKNPAESQSVWICATRGRGNQACRQTSDPRPSRERRKSHSCNPAASPVFSHHANEVRKKIPYPNERLLSPPPKASPKPNNSLSVSPGCEQPTSMLRNTSVYTNSRPSCHSLANTDYRKAASLVGESNGDLPFPA